MSAIKRENRHQLENKERSFAMFVDNAVNYYFDNELIISVPALGPFAALSPCFLPSLKLSRQKSHTQAQNII